MTDALSFSIDLLDALLAEAEQRKHSEYWLEQTRLAVRNVRSEIKVFKEIAR